MIKQLLLFLLFLSIMLGSQQASIIQGHEGEGGSSNLEDANDHCTDPTIQINIAAVGGIQFDRTSIDVPGDTCITILFHNVVDVPHNFAIELVDDDIHFDPVYMDLENSSAVCGQADSDQGETPGLAQFNIRTPNTPTQLMYYCKYPSHFESGMFGYLVVGESVNSDQKIPNIAIVIIVGLCMIMLGVFFYVLKLLYFPKKRI